MTFYAPTPASAPSIAVLIPAFNAAKTIERALKSVENQAYRPSQVIVVDDASSDNTAEILAEFQKRLPLIILRNDVNLGIARSLNRGAQAVSARYIARLDADDAWTTNHLSDVARLLERNSLVLACSRAIYEDCEGNYICTNSPLDNRTIRRRLTWDNPIVHSSTVFLKEAFNASGGYAEDMKWEDYDLWIKLLSKGEFACTNQLTTIYTLSPNSLSRGSKRSALQARLQCQRSACRTFFSRHPFAGCFSLFLARTRLALTPR